MEFDFGQLKSAAVDMLNSTPDSGTPQPEATPADVATPTPSATPSPATPTPSAPADPGQALTAAEQKLFEFRSRNGEVKKLTEDELREAYENGLRQSDYTRKAQEVARQRAEVEAMTQQLQAAYQQMQLAQQQRLQTPQTPEPPIDPNQPMTIGQAMQMAQALAERVQQIEAGVGTQNVQAQEQARQYVEDRLAVASYAEAINGTLNNVFQERPILKTLPEFEDIIRYRVAQLQPETLEQTQEAFKKIAADIATGLEQQFAARQQQQVVQRQALTQQGIEPPGGAVPQPPAPNYRTNDGKLDWAKLRDSAITFVQGS